MYNDKSHPQFAHGFLSVARTSLACAYGLMNVGLLHEEAREDGERRENVKFFCFSLLSTWFPLEENSVSDSQSDSQSLAPSQEGL